MLHRRDPILVFGPLVDPPRAIEPLQDQILAFEPSEAQPPLKRIRIRSIHLNVPPSDWLYSANFPVSRYGNFRKNHSPSRKAESASFEFLPKVSAYASLYILLCPSSDGCEHRECQVRSGVTSGCLPPDGRVRKPHRGDGVGRVSKVLDGIFQAFLPSALLGVLVGFRLLLRGFDLRVGGVFHRLGALVRSKSLQGEQNAAHPDAEKFQDPCFSSRPKSSDMQLSAPSQNMTARKSTNRTPSKPTRMPTALSTRLCHAFEIYSLTRCITESIT